MGRYLKSSEVFNLKGSVAGVTFSNNASGGIIRLKSKNTNRKTLKQSQSRNSFAQSNGGWHTLTDEQKMLWERAGSARKSSGLNEFIRINSVYQKLNSLRTGSSRGIYLNNLSRFEFTLVRAIGTKNPPLRQGFSFFRRSDVFLGFDSLVLGTNPVLGFKMDLIGIDTSIIQNYRFLMRTVQNYNIGFIISGSYGSSQLSGFSNDSYEPLFFSGFSGASTDTNLILTSLVFGIPSNNATKLNNFLKKGTHNYKFKLQFLTNNHQFLQYFESSITITR